MKKKEITIGLVQSKVSSDISENLKKTEKMIKQATQKGAQIICLQELFQTPYFPQWEEMPKDNFAESVNGKTISAMKTLAKELGIFLVIPFYEKRAVPRTGSGATGTVGEKYFNTAVVVNNQGKLVGAYDKVHIPHDPGFYEKEYFEHGQNGYKTFTAFGAKFSVLICYDQWFPEAAREARLAGAEIIFYPTAIGNIIGYKPEGDWHEAWETSMRGHAIANSVYVAAVNRTGREGKVEFYGQSFVSDPFGKVLKRASKNKEETLVQKIDLERNNFFAEGWGFLRNRRPETYSLMKTETLVKRGNKLPKVKHYKDEKRALEGK